MNCRPRKRKQLCSEWFEDAASLPADWDEGLDEGAFLRRASLALQEAAALPDVRPVFALLREGKSILGRAAFQVLRIRPQHLKIDALPAWQRILWLCLLRCLRPRLLVGGQLFRHDVESFWYHPSLPAFEAFTGYRGLLDTCRKQHRVMATLLKELPEDITGYFQHQAPNFLLLRNDISMQLDIPEHWRDMGDYAASLKHKYAQRFRKLRHAARQLSIREFDAEALTEQADEVYALYRQVAEHQPSRLGFLSKEFLPGLKKAHGDTFRIWGFWEADRLVAFASGWVHEHSFDMFYIGLDYARNAALQLYFNILFFSVEQAILLKKPLLILGRTALEAKARVGCRPRYLNSFLHVQNPLLRWIVSQLQERFTERSGAWEQRHPFATPSAKN
ncbi:MAG: GNAT family N-acetyltransferase [Bacteroidetes bacterium]|nr:GNAT family N-acetyltransferase [Bacteroidota bacterium]